MHVSFDKKLPLLISVRSNNHAYIRARELLEMVLSQTLIAKPLGTSRTGIKGQDLDYA
jgi:hypothetical protein